MGKKQVNYELEDIFCGECGETHVFLLENKDGKFRLGLQDILKCLKFAEDEKLVPEIPSMWWLEIYNRYVNIREWLE